MYTTIMIALIAMTVISGLFASSTYEMPEAKPQKEETIMGKLGLENGFECKKYMTSKITALVVFVLSIAGLVTVFIIKG